MTSFALPSAYGRYTAVRFESARIDSEGQTIYTVTLGALDEASAFVELPPLPTDNPRLDIAVALPPVFKAQTIGLLGRYAYAAFSQNYALNLTIPEDWGLEVVAPPPEPEA